MSEANTKTILKDRTIFIFAITLVLTLTFHYVFAEYITGFAFAIFSGLLATGMVITANLREGAKNNWAFIFLIPVCLGILTHILYASEISRALTLFISFGSLALFSYWYSRPIIELKKVSSFWPWNFAFETALPFGYLGRQATKIKSDKKLTSILLGIAVSIPFLLIFLSLFTSADKLFAKSLADVFETQEMAELVIKAIRDFIVALYFLAAGFAVLERSGKFFAEKGHAVWSWMNLTALSSFLIMLNLLFVIFVGFQAAYFFGGESFIAAQDITYADYARNGFFELLFAAGLVFLISWAIYRGTNMKNRLSGFLTVALIAQTGVIIASAVSRLMLYIDAYGLTLARFWAAYCIILIGLVLLSGAVGTIIKMEYFKLAKIIFLGSLMLTSTVLIFNTEKFIAQYNIGRYINGNNNTLDLEFLMYELSSDAVPVYADLHQMQWQDNKIYSTRLESSDAGFVFMTKDEFNNKLQLEKQQLQDKINDEFLSLSLSHFRARDVLMIIK